MIRLKIHRIEGACGCIRAFSGCLMLFLLGFFSWGLIHLVAAEASVFRPLAQNTRLLALQDPHPEAWIELVPISVALLTIPSLAAFTLGTHLFYRGAVMGMGIPLCGMIFPIGQTLFEGPPGMSAGGEYAEGGFFLLAVYLVSILASFYTGDLGSWFCRRRWIREAKADLALAVLRNDPAGQWIETDAGWTGVEDCSARTKVSTMHVVGV